MGNIDDQHRNTNINDKDHLVGQLTTEVAYSQWLHLYDFSMLFDNMFPKIDCLRNATFPIGSFKWFLFAVYGHSPC